MLDVKVSFLSLLADKVGEEEVALSIDESSTIKDLLKDLTEKFGNKLENIIFVAPNHLSKYIILSLNGKDIRPLEYLDISLHDGDEITFLPAIAGG